jgi:hypothetical protein
MNNNDILKRSYRNVAYTGLLPLIILTTSVWFTPDPIAKVLAHVFQLLCSITFFFVTGYVWSLRYRIDLLNYKTYLLWFAAVPSFIVIISFIATLKYNPGIGNMIMFFGLLTLLHSPKPKNLITKFPNWYLRLANRITVILCICLMVMLAYWTNPYSEPLNNISI